jgi:hypothetical protein
MNARAVRDALSGLEGSEDFLKDLHERIEKEKQRQEKQQRREEAKGWVAETYGELLDALEGFGFTVARGGPIIINPEGSLWEPRGTDHMAWMSDRNGVWNENLQNAPTYFEEKEKEEEEEEGKEDDSVIPDDSILNEMGRDRVIVLLTAIIPRHTYASIAREIGVTGPTIISWAEGNFSPDVHHFSRIKGFLKRYRDGTVQANLRPAGVRNN